MAQAELRKLIRRQQEKYVYYIIALTTAAIAFSVNKAIDKPLAWLQVPLAIAILCWGTSIYCGLKYIQNVIGLYIDNHNYLDILQGRDDISEGRPEAIKIGTEMIKTKMEKIGKKSLLLWKLQYIGFYMGGFFFIVWTVLEMYKKMK